MQEREGVHHHTNQPERAQPQEESRYRVTRYGKSRNFAAYDGHTIIRYAKDWVPSQELFKGEASARGRT